MNPLATVMANSGNLSSNGYRPSTYIPPEGIAPTSIGKPTANKMDEFGRVSSQDAGIPYYTLQGNLIIPKTGFSGMSGQGGGGMAVSTPMMKNGMQGDPGGGGSAYTGLLGGVGTAPAGGNTSSDEELRKEEARKSGSVNLAGASPNTQRALEGITAPYQERQFSAPSVPDTIDAGYLQSVQESINKLSTSGASLSANDRQMYISQIANNLMAAKQKLDQQVPEMENPVLDTTEQMEWLEMSEDPFGAKSLMDQWRAENTDLGNLQKTRIDLMKNVQALNDAYKPILKDIKENPDLPKALARRRIEDLATTQKEVLTGFLDQLEIVNQQVDDQNEMVNRAFNIMTFAVGQADKAKDNARQTLSLMMSTGAIAGFTNEEISRYAQTLGVSKQTLQKAKDAALAPKYEIVTNEFADGSIRGIDKTTGKEIWRIQGAAKVGGSGSSATQWETENSEIAAAREWMNKKIPNSGAPVTDANGYLTVEGFKFLLNNTTLSRDRFIKEMAGNISPWNSANYGLTPAERKSLGYE